MTRRGLHMLMLERCAGGGIHCFAVYLVTCEGMSERNRALLLDLARLIKAVRGPWVVMGRGLVREKNGRIWRVSA